MDLMDICYGSNTSIYDVLEVNQDASPKEIQSAFMARRLELYHLMKSTDEGAERVVKGLNDEEIVISEKDFIEKKMDVLAAAFKVLRDPKQRRRYDSKLKRTASSKTSKPSKTASPQSVMYNNEIEESLTHDLDQVQLDGEDEMVFVTPVKKKSTRNIKDSPTISSSMSVSASSTTKVKSSKTTRKSKDKKVPLKNDPSLEERDQYDCDGAIEHYYKDVVERKETGLGSWLRRNKYKSQADTVDTVATELKGSVADIFLTFSQVMTAFSVDDEAIDAMAKNIGDTSDQLSSGRYR